MPADGPVRTQVMGAPNPGKAQQAERVKNFMNYQIMDQMKEYEPEFDSMLFHLPLAGSTFKKVYYDDLYYKEPFQNLFLQKMWLSLIPQPR